VDTQGNKFYWKVRCLSIPLEPKQVDCIHCNGTGKIAEIDSYYHKDCPYCYGSGKRDLVINCYNDELEEYLQQFVAQYYKEKIKNNFLGENI
jgi:RecJ-like exonuclease